MCVGGLAGDGRRQMELEAPAAGLQSRPISQTRHYNSIGLTHASTFLIIMRLSCPRELILHLPGVCLHDAPIASPLVRGRYRTAVSLSLPTAQGIMFGMMHCATP